MDRTESHKASMLQGLLMDEIVDGLHPVRPDGNGQGNELFDAHLSAPVQQHLHRAVHGITDLIEIPNTLGCLFRHHIRVDMGMNIDKMHRDPSVFSIITDYYSPLSPESNRFQNFPRI